MKKLIKVCILLFILSSTLAAQKVKLEWNFKLARTFTMDKYTQQTIVKNGQIQHKRMLKDYMIIVPVDEQDDYTRLKGKYFSYSKNLLDNSSYKLNNNYDMDFLMNKRGEVKVPKDTIMPSIRNIPLFPEKAVQPGDMWKAPGMEVLEFNPPVTLNVDVNYQFVGYENKFNKKLAKLIFNYLWNNVIDHKQADVPFKFIGSSFSTLWYDTEQGLPVYTENIYDLGMIYYNGNAIQYKGELVGYYDLKRTLKEKDIVKEEMYDELSRIDENLNIRKDTENVIVDIGDIYFNFNNSELTKKAQENLNKIGHIFKKYNNFRVLCKGHTDNKGTPEYNQVLSERRAKSVLEYLINNKYIDRDQSSYKGVGEKQPIDSNKTKQGRQKNRRVEIIITPE